MSHKVTVERNTLRFSAAHFTTFGGDCEPLHGHNYDVFIELEGALSSDAWVFDFVELKRVAANICKRLDHRFLLASKNPHLDVTELDGEIEIAFGERRYVMPKGDIEALPIDNTTAERLAEWFAGTLAGDLKSLGAANIQTITVGVEEAPGQAGWFVLRLSRSA